MFPTDTKCYIKATLMNYLPVIKGYILNIAISVLTAAILYCWAY